jgi:hypothetical protein
MWVEPHDNNAPILGYFVSYNQPVFAGGERITLNVSEEKVNVTNLLPGVVYNFTVIAYNDIGNSTASEITSQRTLEEGEYQVSHSSSRTQHCTLIMMSNLHLVVPNGSRAAAIIGGATGATLGTLLLAILITLIIIAVRAKNIRGQAMARMRYNSIDDSVQARNLLFYSSEMEFTHINLAAVLQELQESSDNDQEYKLYAESIDSEYSDVVTPEVEVSTTFIIHFPA